MKINLMKVTPDMATEWLGYNSHNRNLRTPVVAAYAEAMSAGDWRTDIDPIAFAGTLAGRGKNLPVLLNGQHRLQAIAISGVTLELLVIEGLKVADQSEMDAGIRRQLGDQLRMMGHPYSTDLAAALRLVYAYDHDALKRRSYATNATLLRFLNANPEVPDSVVAAARLTAHIGGRRSVFAAGHYIITRIDDPSVEEDLDGMFEALADGNDLEQGNALLLYRNLILSQSSSTATRRRMDQQTQLALFFKAWNAWREGIVLTTMSWRGGGKHPEVFPYPR